MRCCYRSSLLAAASALMLAAFPATSAAAAAGRVLVVGSQPDLVHDTIASEYNPSSLVSSFTPAGLAELAMDAFGLATGNVVRLSSGGDAAAAQTKPIVIPSPAQADVFNHVNAYAMVFVDQSDAAVLESVNAAIGNGYHKVFDLTESARVPSTKIPTVLARELSKSAGSHAIQCAGSEAVCTGKALRPVAVSEAQLKTSLNANKYLDPAVPADIVFARELAQVTQITAAITAKKNALYVVSFSAVQSLSDNKRAAAQRQVTTQIKDLLAALQKTTSGAQIVATKRGGVTAMGSTIAYSRMLTSFKDEIAGSDDEDDDDDDDDDKATNSTKSDVTLEAIAEYQIVLWTSVLLGAILLLVIIAMCNMEPKRDSLLYAKFTTSSGGRKFD